MKFNIHSWTQLEVKKVHIEIRNFFTKPISSIIKTKNPTNSDLILEEKYIWLSYQTLSYLF